MKIRFKRLAALLLCLLMCLGAGCGKDGPKDEPDISDIVIGGAQESAAPQGGAQESAQVIPYATDGNVSYSSTLYLLMMEEAFQNIQLSYELEYTQVLSAAVKLDDGSFTTGSEYVKSNADTSFRWHYVVERMCREAGLELEDSTYYSQALYYASQSYSSAKDYYDFFNISAGDLLEYFMYQYRYNDLFFHTYGEGGDKEIPEAELESLMSANACRVKYVLLPFSDAQSGERLADDEIAARKAMISDYEKRFNGGESFDDIVYDSYLYLSPNVTRDENTDYNYYLSRSGKSSYQDITDAAAALNDGELKAVETDSYCALVLKLPVNGEHSSKWRIAALQLAYTDKYGAQFSEYMVAQFNAIEPDYNKAVKELFTPEAYVSLLTEYYGQ